MDTLRLILAIVAIAACGAGVYAAVELGRAAASTRRFAEETRERLVPLLEKADVTVDAINAELLRIDGIVTQFEEVGERVSSTTSAVHDVVNAPLEAVGTGVRGVVSAWRKSRKNA